MPAFKPSKRWFMLVLIVVLALYVVPTVRASASAIFYRWADNGTMQFTCANTGSDIEIGIGPSRPVEYQNLPAGAQVRITILHNGSPAYPINTYPLAPLVGTGTETFAPFGDTVSSSYPITWEYKYETIVNGNVVYQSSLIVNCAADGTGPVTVQNQEVTSGSGGTGGTGGTGTSAAACLNGVPASSVQGRILQTTPAYFAPDAGSATNIIIPAGTAWWILDARSGFYKLFIACAASPVWVPANVVGPNFDTSGAPLPNAGTSASG